MKIAFLHLGDFHFNSNDQAKPDRIQAVVQSLGRFGAFDGIVIIIAGDIAASGKENEYKAGQRFVGRLIDGISKQYHLQRDAIKTLVVPGNHDINYDGMRRPSADEVLSFSEEERAAFLHCEIIRQREFFEFAQRNICFLDAGMSAGVGWSQLATRKILHFHKKYRIEANLINSGPFSSNKDKGLHYLPADAIAQIGKPSEADIAITVMHHAPDWFRFPESRELESTIAHRCSIAFYGHEHISGVQQVGYNSAASILIQEGGAWLQPAAITISEYNAAIFDTESRHYLLERFSWENEAKRYVNTNIHNGVLPEKTLGSSGLQYQDIYLKELLSDSKHHVSEKISDYYVFPGLRIDVAKEYMKDHVISSIQGLVACLLENNYLAVTGGNASGRTTTLKMLFKELHKKFITIFCGIEDIGGRKQENIIKEAVESIYGEGSYPLFLQAPKQQRIIIIDDVHRISKNHLEKFLKNLENIFSRIVVATTDNVQFDIVQTVKDALKSNATFLKLSISRVYSEKRKELIRRIVEIKVQSSATKQTELVRELESCLKNHKLGFRADVDFIVQFANYYCEHVGELSHSDNAVFSKVFESSIEQAIAEHLRSGSENVNDILVALSELAHHVHFSQVYPMPPEVIEAAIHTYCDYYGNQRLTPDRFLQIAEESGLLVKVIGEIKYRFRSKDHLAYFIAKALNRKFHDTGDQTSLQMVVDHSCFGINADILMYLTYISDNVNIPRLLLRQAKEHMAHWDEFDFLSRKASYLSQIPEEQMSPPRLDEREASDRHESQSEEEADDRAIEVLDIYDYDISDIEKLHNQIIRAFLQMRILARSLSAFISLLPAQDKQELAAAIYQMPNKIFKQWSDSVNCNISSLIDDIVNWQGTPEFSGKKVTRDKLLLYFQRISTELLINLYYTVARYGVTQSTVGHLSPQDCVNGNLSYRIERLMFYERVDDYRSFVAEAEDILDNCEDSMAKNMVRMILRHMLINSDKMPVSEHRRLREERFSPQGQKGVLARRSMAKKG